MFPKYSMDPVGCNTDSPTLMQKPSLRSKAIVSCTQETHPVEDLLERRVSLRKLVIEEPLPHSDVNTGSNKSVKMLGPIENPLGKQVYWEMVSPHRKHKTDVAPQQPYHVKGMPMNY